MLIKTAKKMSIKKNNNDLENGRKYFAKLNWLTIP